MDRLELGFEVKFAAGAPDGTFSGYGAVFGNTDAYGDVLEKGAFRQTLRDWEAKSKYPPMLLQHGGGLFGGGALDNTPIGKWTAMEENSKGLKVEGQLFALGTERGQYIYEGLKAGALDGMSIGYVAKKYTNGTKPGEPRRRLQEVELVELSIVTFPANDKSRVGNVKSMLDALNPRELERELKRELNLSGNDAVTAVAVVKKHLQREAEGHPPTGSREEEAAAELLSTLKKLRAA